MYLSSLTSAVLSTWIAVAVCKTVPRSYLQNPCPPEYSTLASKLSSTAQIYAPGSTSFEDAVTRWSNHSVPVATIVVVPGTENDVVETVKFANTNSIPFLASNGVHGSITTLVKMTKGINIYLSQLDSVKIAKDGTTATIGGGIISKNLTNTLWAAGKQTVTGTCEYVGYLGPALGGGHGWLQGHHGLVSDQIVSMQVVLANGKLVTVNENTNADLFWAMRGAGHNFGIVTSVTSKIYDIKYPNYALETLIFNGDQVEEVYATANNLWLTGNGSMAADLTNWSYWFYDPTIDAEKPVIAMYIIQEGVDSVDLAHTAAFKKLGPIIDSPENGTYLDLAAWTEISLADTPCQKTGNANPRFPIYLKSYNTTAQKKGYDLFHQATTNESTPFSAPDDAATAFAYRSDNLLVAPLLTNTPNGPELDALAYGTGNRIRDVLFEGSGANSLNTYVNYAYGDETSMAWYGSASWRQTRLQELKKQYDPKGQFSFYAPIA